MVVTITQWSHILAIYYPDGVSRKAPPARGTEAISPILSDTIHSGLHYVIDTCVCYRVYASWRRQNIRHANYIKDARGIRCSEIKFSSAPFPPRQWRWFKTIITRVRATNRRGGERRGSAKCDFAPMLHNTWPGRDVQTRRRGSYWKRGVFCYAKSRKLPPSFGVVNDNSKL